MNLSQLVRMAAGFFGTDPLTGPYLAAADLNGNGDLALTDLVLEAALFKTSRR